MPSCVCVFLKKILLGKFSNTYQSKKNSIIKPHLPIQLLIIHSPSYFISISRTHTFPPLPTSHWIILFFLFFFMILEECFKARQIILKQKQDFFFFKDRVSPCWSAGLELPTSGDPPALASKVLGLQAWATMPGQKQDFFYFCFFETVLLCCPGWSAVVHSWLTAASASLVQAILLPLLPESLGLQVCATTPTSF